MKEQKSERSSYEELLEYGSRKILIDAEDINIKSKALLAAVKIEGRKIERIRGQLGSEES